MKLLKKLIAAFAVSAALAPTLALANVEMTLDRAPDRANAVASLQNGAKLFVNYCLNCHAAGSMRYNRMRDIGLTEEQIKNNLLLAGNKTGDLMTVALAPSDAKAWFGVMPPDLSVITRAKASAAGTGGDYLYTYLRSYYKDDTRPTGWNNMVYPNTAMPHVLWELQGVRTAKFVEEKDPHDHTKTVHKFDGYEQVKAGKMTTLEFDTNIADLVAYLEWVAEPAQAKRKQLGVIVLIFLSLLAFFAWRLNASFWKEVK